MKINSSNKILRVLLSALLVPTFVFMCAALCHCPTAQAAVNEVIMTKADSCCCPGENACTDKPMAINKDEAASVHSFEVEKLVSGFKTISQEIKAVFVPDFVSSVLNHPEISPPRLSNLATVQLLI